jgi:hypothetical protein
LSLHLATLHLATLLPYLLATLPPCHLTSLPPYLLATLPPYIFPTPAVSIVKFLIFAPVNYKL